MTKLEEAPPVIAGIPEGQHSVGKHPGLALAVISCAQLMVVLDATIVNVALPTIQRSLHFSPGNLEWIITAYSLTFGGLLLFGGRTGDLFGKRRMFVIGVSLFAFASLLGGFATDQIWLIVTRGLQGVGGAIAAPTALALITTNFEEGQARNRAMGVYAAMSGAGAGIGLLLGGILTDLVSWRWILFVNVPIGIIVALVAPRVLREGTRTRKPLDVPGALTATAGMVSLVYGLTSASTHSWSSAGTVGPLALAAGLLISFILIELRHRAPLMPLSIFANRNRASTYLMMLLIGTALFSMFFFLTQFLQDILGYSALRAGVAFLPMSLAILVTAGATSRVVGRIGIRLPLIVGPLGAATGMFLLSRLNVHTSYLGLLGPLMLVAVGMGLTFVPLTLAAVSGVTDEEAGLASALLNTAQQIGGALGLAVLATIATSATRTSITRDVIVGHPLTHHLKAVAITHGYTTAFLVGSGLTLAGVVVAAAGFRFRDIEVPSELAVATTG